GVTAAVPRPLGFVTQHPLSWMIAVPWIAALVLVGLWVAGRRDASVARAVALAAAAVECALAVWVLSAFDPDLTRADGNDGLQLVEHTPWIRALGAAWFVAVDGASVPLL